MKSVITYQLGEGEKGWKALHADPTPGNLGMNLSVDSYFTQVLILILNFDIFSVIRGVLPSFARMVTMVSGVDTTGGWATAAAFSSGIQSSKLDLPTFQLFWSFTACSIERVAGCRLVDHLEFTYHE